MNKKQKRKLTKCMSKIIHYATYVDCFNRIINEMILNGESNFKSNDLPNISELTSIYARKLYKLSIEASSKLEFMNM